MTVNVTNENRKSFAGNGVTTEFSYDSPLQIDTDLAVYIVDEDLVLTPQVLDTDYTVEIEDDLSEATITFILAAPATGDTVLAYANPAQTQGLDLKPYTRFPPEEVERALDRAVLMIQYLTGILDRMVKLPDNFLAGFDPSLPPELEAGQTIIVNETADGFEAGPNAQENAEAAAASEAAAAASAGEAANSAAAASTSEGNAATSEANAAASEAAAAVSAGEAGDSADESEAAALLATTLLFDNYETYDSADSPVTITNGEKGLLILIDTTTGNFALNLAALAGMDADFKVGVVKMDDSENVITVTGNGAETIDGGADYDITAAGVGALFTPNSASDWNVGVFAAIGASGGGGMGGGLIVWHDDPTSVDNDGVVTLASDARQALFVVGDGGARSANVLPFTAPPEHGAEIKIFGSSNDDYVKFSHNDNDGGMILNGDFYAQLNSCLTLVYNETTDRYYEISRKD